MGYIFAVCKESEGVCGVERASQAVCLDMITTDFLCLGEPAPICAGYTMIDQRSCTSSGVLTPSILSLIQPHVKSKVAVLYWLDCFTQ